MRAHRQLGATTGVQRGRLPQLDGLRGLAALVVVVHHALLVTPALAAAYRENVIHPDGWVWWMVETPLHLAWNGPAAVILFFVISGFVLSLPFTGGSAPAWRHYFPRRLVRLYLPVWGAVAFALILYTMTPRADVPTFSWWVNAHARPTTMTSLLHDAFLLRGTTWLNSPLWSLQWEVMFSLLLPLYVYFCRHLQQYWLPQLGACIIVPHIAPNAYLRFLPIFGIGVVMAMRREGLNTLCDRIPKWGWPLLLVLSLGALSADWYPFDISNSRVLLNAGAATMIFTFYGWTTVSRFTRHRLVQWLGTRSFSLYLVHEPIIVTIANVTGTTHPVTSLALALPASLFAASVFYRLVERPSHHLSRLVGTRIRQQS